MPRAADIALPLAVFAAAILVVVLGGLAARDVALYRAHSTALTSAVMTLPALWLFLLRAGRRPLGQAWRLWWTAGWLLIVIHLWWGLGVLHDWDVGSVFARQGFWIAGPIFLLEIVWTIDVILAWTRRDWAEARGGFLAWQWVVWAITAANYFVSLMIFRNDIESVWLGAALTAVLVFGLLRRLAEEEA
jgi:hypothetical protein